MGVNIKILKEINDELLKQGGSTKHDNYNFNVDVLLDILQNLQDISRDLGLKYKIVETLPVTPVAGTIYLILNGGSKPNIYDEYMYIDDDWEKIGSTEIDLSDYYNKTETNDLLSEKVNKVTGKSLSTNDYTTAEKTKLAGLSDKLGINKTADYSLNVSPIIENSIVIGAGIYFIKFNDMFVGIVIHGAYGNYEYMYKHGLSSMTINSESDAIRFNVGTYGTITFHSIV